MREPRGALAAAIVTMQVREACWWQSLAALHGIAPCTTGWHDDHYKKRMVATEMQFDLQTTICISIPDVDKWNHRK
jgi:hypothetical protein